MPTGNAPPASPEPREPDLDSPPAPRLAQLLPLAEGQNPGKIPAFSKLIFSVGEAEKS